MTRTVLIALFIATITATAHARLGETPDQCEQRYGKAVREIPGRGPIEYCRVYRKDGISISAVFIKGRTTPKAGCILYTTHQGDSTYSRTRKLTSEEQQSLLQTVPGTWTLPRNEPAPILQGGGRVRELSVKPNGIRDSRLKAVRDASSAALNTVYPYGPQLSPAEIGHNGLDKYAFTIYGGMALTYFNAADAIVEWSRAIEAQRKEDRKPDSKKFKGF